MSDLVTSFANSGIELLTLREKIAKSLQTINSIHSDARSRGLGSLKTQNLVDLPQAYKTVIEDSQKEIQLVERMLENIQQIQNKKAELEPSFVKPAEKKDASAPTHSQIPSKSHTHTKFQAQNTALTQSQLQPQPQTSQASLEKHQQSSQPKSKTQSHSQADSQPQPQPKSTPTKIVDYHSPKSDGDKGYISNSTKDETSKKNDDFKNKGDVSPMDSQASKQKSPGPRAKPHNHEGQPPKTSDYEALPHHQKQQQELLPSIKIKKKSGFMLKEKTGSHSTEQPKSSHLSVSNDKKRSLSKHYDSDDDYKSSSRSKPQNGTDSPRTSKSKSSNNEPFDQKSRYGLIKHDSTYSTRPSSYDNKRSRDSSRDEYRNKSSRVKLDSHSSSASTTANSNLNANTNAITNTNTNINTNTKTSSSSNNSSNNYFQDGGKSKSSRYSEDSRSRNNGYNSKSKESSSKTSKTYGDDSQESGSGQYSHKSNDYDKHQKGSYEYSSSSKKQKTEPGKYSSSSYSSSYKNSEYDRDKRYNDSSKHSESREYSKHNSDKHHSSREYPPSTRTGDHTSSRDSKNSESLQRNSDKSKSYMSPDSTKPFSQSRSTEKDSDSVFQSGRSSSRYHQSRNPSTKQEYSSSSFTKNSHDKANTHRPDNFSSTQDKAGDNPSNEKHRPESHRYTSRSGSGYGPGPGPGPASSTLSGSGTVPVTGNTSVSSSTTTTVTTNPNTGPSSGSNSTPHNEKPESYQRKSFVREYSSYKQNERAEPVSKAGNSRTRSQGASSKDPSLEPVKSSGAGAEPTNIPPEPKTRSSSTGAFSGASVNTRITKSHLENQIVVGSFVAAKIPVDGGGEQADEWVLGIVRKVNAARTKFVVEDADDDESIASGTAAKAQYELDQRNILFVADPIMPIGITKSSGTGNSRRKSQSTISSSASTSSLPVADAGSNSKVPGQGDKIRIAATQAMAVGERVLGIYPGTTVFYHGTVQLTPGQNRAGYSLFMASVPHLGLPPVVMSLIDRWDRFYPSKPVFQVVFDNDEGKLIDVPAIMIIKN